MQVVERNPKEIFSDLNHVFVNGADCQGSLFRIAALIMESLHDRLPAAMDQTASKGMTTEAS